MPASHVALIRGINVGGNNLIPMSSLAKAFADAGFEDVRTYIQSGNVVFRTTDPTAAAALEKKIEAALSKRFGYEARVVVRTRAQFRSVVKNAPKGWPRADTRCNLIFVKRPATTKTVLSQLSPKQSVDTVAVGAGVVYLGTRLDQRTKSGLPRFIGKPAYKWTTIRTMGTCQKILDLMDA